MAKGQYLSKHQQGIVKRHYEHRDAVTMTKLQEIVSDLAVAESEKAREKLWAKAAEWLAKAGAPAEKIAKATAARSLEALATLVGELQRG